MSFWEERNFPLEIGEDAKSNRLISGMGGDMD